MEDAELLGWLAKAVVGVTWTDRGADGKLDGFVFSGFIMSVKGFWILVTAGHIVEDINSRLESGRKFEKAAIVDSWGHDARHKLPIPFPSILDLPQGHIDDPDRGIDYAFFVLTTYYREQLAVNITPFDEASWKNPPESFDWFAVVGFLADRQRANLNEVGSVSSLAVKPVMIPYAATEEPAAIHRSSRRLFFQPTDSTTKTVNGMSGGPIMGFKEQADDTRVWLVGVQSQEYEGIAIGCPMEIFGESLSQAITEELTRRGMLGGPSHAPHAV